MPKRETSAPIVMSDEQEALVDDGPFDGGPHTKQAWDWHYRAWERVLAEPETHANYRLQGERAASILSNIDRNTLPDNGQPRLVGVAAAMYVGRILEAVAGGAAETRPR